MNQQMNPKKRLSTLPSWRSMVLVAACLLSFTPVAAQQKIDRLMDEIESRGVDVNTVIKRDKKTGKMTFMTRQMTFRSRKGNYAKKLERAFDEESRKAVLVNHSNGRYKLEFEDAEGNTSYYMLTSGKGEPTVKLCKSFRGHGYTEDKSYQFGWDAETMKRYREQMKRYREQMERYREQMERLRKNFSEGQKEKEKRVAEAREQAAKAQQQAAKVRAEMDALQKDMKEHPERYDISGKNGATIITRKKGM